MNNIAVIGCGFWGPNLIRTFSRIEGVHITVCDVNINRLNELKLAYPAVTVTQNFNDILLNNEINAVALATPASTHFEMAKSALEKNKHVFVEKPLYMLSAQAEQLIKIAREKKKILMVGHTFEYNPAVVKLKEYIDSGELGNIYYAYSSRLNLGQIREDINAMWNLAPHDFSILIYLLGGKPSRVSAIGKAFIQNGIEDTVFITAEFGDILAHVHVSWLYPSKVRQLTIVGDRKMVIYDDLDNEAKLKIYDKGISKISNEETYGEYFLKLRTGDIYIPKIDLSEPLKLEVNHFVNCIRHGTESKTNGENGLRVVKTLEAAQRSLKNNGIFVDIV